MIIDSFNMSFNNNETSKQAYVLYKSLDTILKLSSDLMVSNQPNQKITTPTPSEFITMIRSTSFLTSLPIHKKKKSSFHSKKHIYDNNKNYRTIQVGRGWNNIVLSYLRSYTKSILGIVNDDSKCGYIESTLNILCWTAFLYTITMNSFRKDTTIYKFMEYLSGPNDFILSLIPSTNHILKKTVASRLSDYCIGIWNDYQRESLSGMFRENLQYAVATIIKLTKVNQVTYEYLYLRPIMCSLSYFIEDCKERCR